MFTSLLGTGSSFLGAYSFIFIVSPEHRTALIVQSCHKNSLWPDPRTGVVFAECKFTQKDIQYLEIHEGYGRWAKILGVCEFRPRSWPLHQIVTDWHFPPRASFTVADRLEVMVKCKNAMLSCFVSQLIADKIKLIISSCRCFLCLAQLGIIGPYHWFTSPSLWQIFEKSTCQSSLHNKSVMLQILFLHMPLNFAFLFFFLFFQDCFFFFFPV